MPCNLITWRKVWALGMGLFIAFMTEAALLSLLWQKRFLRFFFFFFLLNPYLKIDGTSLLSIFLVKYFEEKEIGFLKERFCQKLSSNDENNWANNIS